MQLLHQLRLMELLLGARYVPTRKVISPTPNDMSLGFLHKDDEDEDGFCGERSWGLFSSTRETLSIFS
jgi:hypothetical protein